MEGVAPDMKIARRRRTRSAARLPPSFAQPPSRLAAPASPMIPAVHERIAAPPLVRSDSTVVTVRQVGRGRYRILVLRTDVSWRARSWL